MLSNRSRYALRAMIHLAGLPGGGPATIAEIADIVGGRLADIRNGAGMGCA